MRQRESKPSPRRYDLIDPEERPDLYDMLRDLVVQHHDEIAEASIVLAWCYGWNSDVDGRLVLGKCKKVTELDHRLHGRDFVIILNADAWKELDDRQRRALIDHELCHAAPSLDPDTGDQKEDDSGRKLWRLRKHDIEEFSSIVERYGLYKADLASFAEAANRRRSAPLFADQEVATEVDAAHAALNLGRAAIARDPSPGLRSAVQKFRDSIPAGTRVSVQLAGQEEVVIGDRTAETEN